MPVLLLHQSVRMEASYIPSLLIQISLTLFILLANFSIVFCIFKTPSLRHKLTNFFVLAMGILGILAGVTVCPLTIVEFIWPQFWEAKECLLLGIIYQFVLYASIATAMLIAIDRHFSIVKPMFHAAQLTLTRTLTALATITTITLSFAICPSIEAYNGKQLDACTPNYISYGMRLTVLVTCFIIPFSVIVVMYSSIFKVAWQAQSQIVPNVPPGNTIFTIQSIEAPLSSRKTWFLKGKSSKAGKTLLLIVTVYSVLWTPHFVCFLTGYYPKWVVWTTLSSFIANPIFYGMLNRAIREEMLRYFACRKGRDAFDFPAGDEDFWQFLQRTATPSRT